MTKFDLFVATRASHAALLPVVLIAASINEARPLVAPRVRSSPGILPIYKLTFPKELQPSISA